MKKQKLFDEMIVAISTALYPACIGGVYLLMFMASIKILIGSINMTDAIIGCMICWCIALSQTVHHNEK